MPIQPQRCVPNRAPLPAWEQNLAFAEGGQVTRETAQGLAEQARQLRAELGDVAGQKPRRDQVMVAAIAEGWRDKRRASPKKNSAAAHQIPAQIAGFVADRQGAGD